MEDLPGLRLADNLSAETSERYRETSSLLRVALQSVCADFQPERYVKVLPSHQQSAKASYLLAESPFMSSVITTLHLLQ